MEQSPEDVAARVLVVDDDEQIRDLAAQYLGQHGFVVSLAGDGRQMRQVLAREAIDLIVLDIMLPGEDGFSLCRELRADSDIPIIMLTAMGEDADRIIGLELGADDYLPKPVNPRELLARIRAVLRRAQGGAAPGARHGQKLFRFAGWVLDAGRRRLESPEGVVVELSTGEFELLLAFVKSPQRVLTRDDLSHIARGHGLGAFDRGIDVQVGRLRRKIESDPEAPKLIKTVRARGYLFTPVVEGV